VVGVLFVGLVGANPTVGGFWENDNTVAIPLEITILSPRNTTYSSKDLNLTIQITKTETPYPMEVTHFDIMYDLDSVPLGSGPGVEGIVNNDCIPEIYYNTVLHDLHDGKHGLLVMVECFPENVSAYWVRSKIYYEVYFSVDSASNTPSSPSPSPTLAPNSTPSPEPTNTPERDSLTTTLVMGSIIAVVASVGLGLLVYFKKRRRLPGLEKNS
jgi:hypothetical protein